MCHKGEAGRLQKIGALTKLPAARGDGGHSSMVEPQIVVLVVAGSSPVGHPFPFRPARLIVSVAQLDRASDFGSEGWGFESLQARSLVK